MFRDLEHLADKVYYFPRDTEPGVVQPNVGIIKLDTQTIVIDAGNGPRHARQVMAAMAGMRFAPIETIIYTHNHWDHTFGANTINPTRIIAHDANITYMQQYAGIDWSPTHIREMQQYPTPETATFRTALTAITDWRDFTICMPTMTFSNTLTLHIDDITLELQHVGGRHADDSIIVKIPEAGVVFLGDCYYPEPMFRRAEGDIDLDLNMLDEIADDAYNIYLDGHGDPRDYAAFTQMIAEERARQNA